MAGGLQTSRGGNGPGGITNFTAQTTGSLQTVTLTQPANIIRVFNYSGTSIAVDFNGGTPVVSASGGNGIQIPALSGSVPGSVTYDGSTLTTFTLIGTASLLYGVLAN